MVERHTSFGHKEKLNLPFITSKSVTRVFQDMQGGYWMSTLQDGVYYVPELSFSTQNLPDGSKIKAALSKNGKTFIIDQRGKVFLQA